MATRGTYFFARPQEFTDILNGVIRSLNLHVIYAIRMQNERVKLLHPPLEVATLNQPSFYDIFLTDHKVEEGILVADINRAKEGWIQVVLPKEVNGKLFEGNIGIKTDWYDEETQTIYDKKENLALFNKVARMIKKNFKYPVIGYDIQTGKSHTYQVGYTEAVKRFSKEGGELVQGDGYGCARFVIDAGDIVINPNYRPGRPK